MGPSLAVVAKGWGTPGSRAGLTLTLRSWEWPQEPPVYRAERKEESHGLPKENQDAVIKGR